eukprot:COSAG02_NODE_39321_length_418_cov_1.141066_1_plen_94_part_10
MYRISGSTCETHSLLFACWCVAIGGAIVAGSGTVQRRVMQEDRICTAGTYDSDSDPSTPCDDCPAGRYSDEPGATECVLVCLPGSYSPSAAGFN